MLKGIISRNHFVVCFLSVLLLFALVSYPISHFVNDVNNSRNYYLNQNGEVLQNDLYSKKLRKVADKHENVSILIKQVYHKLKDIKGNIESVKKFKNLQDVYYKQLKLGHVNTILKSSSPRDILMFEPKTVKYTHPKVIIVVLSTVTGSSNRNLIRQTWASIKNLTFSNSKKVVLNWKVYFVIGRRLNDMIDDSFNRKGKSEVKKLAGDPLLQEIKIHKDVIVTSELDNAGISISKFYSAMYWINNKFQYDYLHVVNDSMFVNIPTLYEFVHKRHKPTLGLYAGDMQFEEKLATTLHPNIRRYEPRHATGHTFIITKDVAVKIVKNFKLGDKRKPFDEFYGDLVMKSGFDVWEEQGFFLDKCIYSKRSISIAVKNEQKQKCFEYLYGNTLKDGKNVAMSSALQ